MRNTLDLLHENENQPGDEDSLGVLTTEKGSLPLEALDVQAEVFGLCAKMKMRQTFVNTYEDRLEATYIFPLPGRFAVTSFRMVVGERVIEGEIQERGKARATYEKAIDDGHRAAIAEEERPEIFTVRVGNIPPEAKAVVELELSGPLDYQLGEATLRIPLLVAPKYISGVPLPGASVGDGTACDTDQVPDASRISPPTLLPGYPNPVQLSVEVVVWNSGLSIGRMRSTLHATVEEASEEKRIIRLEPGERLNRDFILRLELATDQIQSRLTLNPDTAVEGESAGTQKGGTFALTVLPPRAQTTTKPRDVIFVLDRSGSMDGWKMVAARRALARMVDTLRDTDRFQIYAFDNSIECPNHSKPQCLTEASDRNRYRALEFLAKINARGGTEMAAPLSEATRLLSRAQPGREPVLVLITDGQVGSESAILKLIGKRLETIRTFTLGIDRAVNAGFLKRLADLGGGISELVESEDRLDEVMNRMHRAIRAPVLTNFTFETDGVEIDETSIVPARLPDLFEGVPVTVFGRYQGALSPKVTCRGKLPDGKTWLEDAQPSVMAQPLLGSIWARGRIRQLEDLYEMGSGEKTSDAIVETSIRFSVLSRFTAFVAVDRSEVLESDGAQVRLTQAVESPDGWEAGCLPPMSLSECHGSSVFEACFDAPEGDHEVIDDLNDTRAMFVSRKSLPQSRESGFARASRRLFGGQSGMTNDAAILSTAHERAKKLERFVENWDGKKAPAFAKKLHKKLKDLLRYISRYGLAPEAVKLLATDGLELEAALSPSDPDFEDLIRNCSKHLQILVVLLSEGASAPRRKANFWK